MTQTPAASSAVNALLDKQRELLCAVAVTQEALNQYLKDLADVRAQLRGVQLGQQLAAEATQAADD
ncbi:hypothetical protein [Caulobacter segnis]|uniref:Uncharacterized protein n=1 Tax=Caulobacter segnis TaxID=88688 RepID=A0A2W5WP40_9CAUL|nr:hypothetical protein [Caulobacter segnis]PZR35778.1 MAG: hypothetical protein DI526_05680 [Caulobacter segnis]